MAVPSLLPMVLDFYKQYPQYMILAVVFMAIVPVQDVYLPHVVGKVIDSIKHGGDTPAYYITLLIIITIAVQLSWLFYDAHQMKMLPELQNFLAINMFRRILERYEEEHEELPVGELISKFARAPSILTIWTDRIKSYVIPYMVAFAIATIYFFTIDSVLGIGFLILLVIFGYSVYKSINMCSCITVKRDQSFSAYQEYIDDVLRNLFSVYGSNKKDEEVENVKQQTRAYTEGFKSTIQCSFQVKKYTTPMIIVFLSMMLARSLYLLKHSKLNAGSFVSLFVITLYVLDNVLVLNDQIRDVIFDWGIIKSSSDVVDRKKSLTNSTLSTSSIPQNGLGLYKVSLTYPGSTMSTLKDISLHVPRGQKVAIVGNIGSGKSTILKLLMKYIHPTEGFVYWDGKSYDDISTYELRHKIGYVPQQPILFNRTVYENITYGLDISRPELEQKLKDLKVWDEFVNLEHGLDTNIAKNGSKISGGQRQLIWCMRVLLRNPEIIILDEPTASVNEKIKTILRNVINEVMEHKTVIMVTHDEYLMKYADRVITLEAGTIIKDTTEH